MTDGANGQTVKRKVTVGLLATLTIVATAWFLRATYVVSMPLAFAFFLALLMRPVQVWAERQVQERFKWLGLVLTVVVMLGFLAVVLALLWLSLTLVIAKVPEYVDRLQEAWSNLEEMAKAHQVSIPQELMDPQTVGSRLVSMATTVFTHAWQIVALLVLIFFMAVLLLMEWDNWRDTVLLSFPGEPGQAAVETVDTLARKIRRYLVVWTFMSVLSGVIAGIWLWAMGVDLAFLWGLLFFAFNYVPNIGSVVAMIPPTLTALVQFNIGWALVVVLGLAVLEQFTGNYLAPRFQGRTLMISPLVLLLSILFWGWVWGIPGAVLGVPMTVTLVVVGSHIPALRPMALLFSRTPGEEPGEVAE